MRPKIFATAASRVSIRPMATLRRFLSFGRTPSNLTLGYGLVFMVMGLCVTATALANLSEATGATLAQAGGAFATVGGILTALGTFMRQSEDQRSRFYLDEALKGLAQGHALLEDGNNSRQTWILAARILARTKHLSESITVQEHLDVWEIAKDDYRLRFHSILRVDERDVASFFLGFDDPKQPLPEAAKHQADHHEIRYIPESAIAVIHDFAQYPNDYEDPLPPEVSDVQLQRMRLIFPSLFRYINFIRRDGVPLARVRIWSGDAYDD